MCNCLFAVLYFLQSAVCARLFESTDSLSASVFCAYFSLRIVRVSCCNLCVFQVENCNPSNTPAGDMQYEVISCKSQSQLDREKAALTLNLTQGRQLPQDIPTPGDPEQEESGQYARTSCSRYIAIVNECDEHFKRYMHDW